MHVQPWRPPNVVPAFDLTSTVMLIYIVSGARRDVTLEVRHAKRSSRSFLDLAEFKIGCSILLLACTTLTAQEPPLTKYPPAPEQQALRVLNDSELARTVKPTSQDAP